MGIGKDYSKCNLMLGGSNKCKKNKEKIIIKKWKKLPLMSKLYKFINIESNSNSKKQLG